MQGQQAAHLPADVDAHVHEGEGLAPRWRRDLHVVHAGQEVAREELEVPRLHLRRSEGACDCCWVGRAVRCGPLPGAPDKVGWSLRTVSGVQKSG